MLIVPVILFIVLQPGLLFTLVKGKSGSVNIKAILLHALIFAVILLILKDVKEGFFQSASSTPTSPGATLYNNTVAYPKGSLVIYNMKVYEQTGTGVPAGTVPDKVGSGWRLQAVSSKILEALKAQEPQAKALADAKAAVKAAEQAAAQAKALADAKTPQPYDNYKTYQTDALISYNGKAYKLSKFIGAAGYNPGHPSADWKEMVYMMGANGYEWVEKPRV